MYTLTENLTCVLNNEYYSNGTDITNCSNLTTGCKSCDTNGTQCLSCEPRYFYDSANSSCTACSSIHSYCFRCTQTLCL